MENKTQNRLPIVLKVYLYKNRPIKETGSTEANPKTLSLLAYDSVNSTTYLGKDNLSQ